MAAQFQKQNLLKASGLDGFAILDDNRGRRAKISPTPTPTPIPTPIPTPYYVYHRVVTVTKEPVITATGQLSYVDNELFRSNKSIKKEEKYYEIHIPIIALTAHVSGEEANNTILAGIDAHLGKPLKKENMLEAISLSDKSTTNT
ncbi:hypothetical protein LWI28_018163 [Acer negundo]|uniref:Response regulatory domain-containing protein n=1 Tax=Acer negundo TaxID=4023 RepID=A0AAD5JEH2_ACENE|nr:hypothetical protein LWI28_018163 [Acer negundo]